ncbi:MAG: hypothetical protein IT582_05885, partial [Opitutaceae bacterium]|nr:hypothetical protein [Opitutaceae bacterium]
MKAPKLSPQQVSDFHAEGYVIVPDVFDPVDLEPLRAALHAEIDRKARELQAQGKLANLHPELDFDRRLAAIYRDSKENGELLMRHLEGLRGGG